MKTKSKIIFCIFLVSSISSVCDGMRTCGNDFIGCLGDMSDIEYSELCTATVELAACAQKCPPHVVITESFLLEAVKQMYIMFGRTIVCKKLVNNKPDPKHFSLCKYEQSEMYKENMLNCRKYLDSRMGTIAKGVICSNLDVFVHRCTVEFKQLFPTDFSPSRIKFAADLLKMKLVNPLIRKYIPDFLDVYACDKFIVNATAEVSGSTSFEPSNLQIVVAVVTAFKLIFRNF